ncbi:MAG: PAS domain S-box protein [Planctomycetes bacterium]|nr:PAS domain S-box protein [Planctomycetota bacterium]
MDSVAGMHVSNRWTHSVVTRMVGCFCLGGVLLSIGLGVIEYSRSMKLVEVATSQQMLLTARNLQDVLHSLIAAGRDNAVQSALNIFTQDPRIVGVRLDTRGEPSITAGRWDNDMSNHAIWVPGDGGSHARGHLELDRRTILMTSFLEGGKTHTVEMLIDGPFIRQRTQGQVIAQLSSVWIVLGTLTLVGLLMLRRWLIAPLSSIIDLTRSGAGAAAFEHTGERLHGEFGDVCHAISRMLRRLDETTDQLRRREQAFEHLYQFAPAAMISVDPDGKVIQANRRAAELLGWADERGLVGAEILSFIAAEDRGLFRQCIDRLDLDRLHGAELRIELHGDVRDLSVEFAAVHDKDGRLAHVRLSLIDITETKRLDRHIAEQRRLMDLVIHHMSDAILLIGADGRILSGNHRLGQLLNINVNDLVGHDYDPADFWSRLELVNYAAFMQRLAPAIARLDHPIQEQVETRDGAFLFQIIPVFDERQQLVAQLWVVQEVSANLRNRRLLEQQAQQLRALQRVGRNLQQIDDIETLLTRAMMELDRVFGVEAMGLALRGTEAGHRCRQILKIAETQCPLNMGAPLAHAVASELMPRVLPNRATSFWTDLSQYEDWTEAFTGAGFESMAATTIGGRYQTQGVFWIARRGGNRIERHHLFLLEALAPLLAVSLENAQLRQSMCNLSLTDPVTGLPSRQLLKRMMARQVARVNQPWTMIALELDHFDALPDTAGERLLKRVSGVLLEQCRASDEIVRFDKSQFIVISPTLEIHQSQRYAQRLADAVARLDHDHPGQFHVTVAVANLPHDQADGRAPLTIVLERLADARQKRLVGRAT